MMGELKSLVKLVYCCLLMTAIFGGFEWGATVILCNMTGIQSMYYPLLAMAVSFNFLWGSMVYHKTLEAQVAAAKEEEDE